MTSRKIIASVSVALDIPVSTLKSKNRKRTVVDAKRICMTLIRQNCMDGENKVKLKTLGKIFGNIHHASVLHSMGEYEFLAEHDKEFSNKVESVLNLL